MAFPQRPSRWAMGRWRAVPLAAVGLKPQSSVCRVCVACAAAMASKATGVPLAWPLRAKDPTVQAPRAVQREESA